MSSVRAVIYINKLRMAFMLLLLLTGMACNESPEGAEESSGLDKEVVIPELECSRETPCELRDGDMTVQLWFMQPLYYLTPFSIQMRLVNPDAIKAEEVVVSFNMAQMDMGVNRFALQQQDGLWNTEAIIPICVTGKSEWLMDIAVQADSKTYQVQMPVHFKDPL